MLTRKAIWYGVNAYRAICDSPRSRSRGAASRRCRNRSEITVLLCKQRLSPVWLSCRRKAIWYRAFSRARFHSRGQYLLGKFIGTKESVCRRKEFNSLTIGLVHQHGRRFIVLGHQYGRRDVM